MVIGGQAVQLYGEARMTQDIDITLGIGTEGLARVMDVCRACGLNIRTNAPEELVRDTMVLPAIEEKTTHGLRTAGHRAGATSRARRHQSPIRVAGRPHHPQARGRTAARHRRRPHHPRQEPGLRPGLHRTLAPSVQRDPEPRHLLRPPPPASGLTSDAGRRPTTSVLGRTGRTWRGYGSGRRRWRRASAPAPCPPGRYTKSYTSGKAGKSLN